MNDSDKVYVDDLAWIGWHMLPAHVKADILRELDPLAGVAVEQWPRTRIKRWLNEENLYVLPVWNGAMEVFVLFYPKNGRIHIDTFATQGKIEMLSGRTVAEMIGP